MSAPPRRKVFGIGCPRTGTKTLQLCFRTLGFRNTSWHEEFFQQAVRGETEPALRFAETYESFDDVPWCMLYAELDRRFPGSKFVLTVRSDSATWLESFRTLQARVAGRMVDDQGRTATDAGPPVWPDGVRGYEQHNNAVRAYLRDRPDDLLELCWERGDGWEEICGFLQLPVPDAPIPHENRTDPREARVMQALLKLERHLPARLRGKADAVRRPLARLLRHALPRGK